MGEAEQERSPSQAAGMDLFAQAVEAAVEYEVAGSRDDVDHWQDPDVLLLGQNKNRLMFELGEEEREQALDIVDLRLRRPGEKK